MTSPGGEEPEGLLYWEIKTRGGDKHAFLELIHLWAGSAEVVLGLQLPFSHKYTLYLTLVTELQNVKCSADLDPHRLLSRDISWSVTSTVQSATCKPRKVEFKEHGTIN